MRTCLIVTSEPDTQREYGTMVRMLGLEVVSALSIEGAREQIRQPIMAVIVIDEWWRTGEDPMDFIRQLPTRNRPPIVVVQKVRLTGLNNGADYAMHRDDPAYLREVLAHIELTLHEQELAAAAPEMRQAAE